MSRALSFLASLFVCAVIFSGATALTSEAQTFTVIHNFTGYLDGSDPSTGTMDSAGNFYGTTLAGGTHQPTCNTYCGTVFRISLRNGAWVLDTLYNFSGEGSDGASPREGVIFGPDGALYGTTLYNGCQACSGTVFRLVPQMPSCRNNECNWLKTTLHSFGLNSPDGYLPSSGVIFDAAGNLYGTLSIGGNGSGCGTTGCGAVYELSPAGGTWTEKFLYTFQGGADGQSPSEGVVFNSAGNFFGTAEGPGNYGSVYELTPSGSGFSKSFIHVFTGGADGSGPIGLIIDSAANLYGTTWRGGMGHGGTVYQLSPQSGGWSFRVLYPLLDPSGGPGSIALLTRDSAGNLYGTTEYGGQYGYGTVFKLTAINGHYTYTALHDFTGGVDGRYPGSRVVLDSHGKVFGTTLAGGTINLGVAFMIEQ